MPSLLTPSGLWLLALLAPLVLLYVLKVRRKKAVVSSTWLWSRHARDLLARSPFRRLVAQTSLILQVLALCLLALALSGPATMGTEAPAGNVAIVIDVSASMSAEDANGVPAIERAREAAKDVLAGLPPTSRALLIEAGAAPRLATPLERDRQRVGLAIDRSSALDVEGDLPAAVALAVERMAGIADARVVVVTDGHWSSPLDLPSPAVPVEVLTVGGPVDNVAIVRADVRAEVEADGGDVAHALLLVASFADEPREVFVTTRRRSTNDVLDARKLVVEAGQKAPVSLAFAVRPEDAGEPLLFELSPGDAMSVDDVAYATIPASPRLPAVVAGPEEEPSPWIARALASDDKVRVARSSVEGLRPDTVPADALVVVHGACPADVPGGDLVIVAPPPGNCFGVAVGAPVSSPALTSWEAADPRLRFLTLDDVSIASASYLTPRSASLALVRARDGVLVADASTPARTITILGFDPGESDWPLKASFVLFVRNLTELFRAKRTELLAGSAQTGVPLRILLPRDATDVVVTDPSGKELPTTLREALLVPPPDRVGFHRIDYVVDGRALTKQVPVNLASAAESDLRALDEAPKTGAIGVRDAREPARGYRDHAWILAIVVLTLVLLEYVLFTRRSGATLPRSEPRPERSA